MPVDRYTKAVLTVIAAGIVAIVAQNAIKTSYAQGDQVQKVAICDIRAIKCANVIDIAGGSLATVTRDAH